MLARFIKGSVLSIILRGITLFSKFFLLIYIAKVLPIEDLGVYGLFVTTLGFFLYFLGMDFYTYTTRELIELPKEKWIYIIKDQFVFYALIYAIFLPVILVVFYSGILEWKYLWWFYWLLILEHISQEFYRLLVAMQKPLTANIMLFIRSGLWCYIVISIMYGWAGTQSLSTLFLGWAIGAGLSLLIPLFLLYRMEWGSAFTTPVEWQWIKKGVRVASIFFIGTLAIRGVLALDKTVIKMLSGDVAVGVYIFYFNIANAIQTFVDAGVVMHFYPKIIAAYQAKNYQEFNRLSKLMGKGIIMALIVLVVSVVILIEPVLQFVNKAIYLEHLSVLWILVGVSIITCLSLVPHYQLYAIHADRMIMKISIAAFFIMLMTSTILVAKWGAEGSALALLIVMLFIMLSKQIIYIKLRKKGSVLQRSAY